MKRKIFDLGQSKVFCLPKYHTIITRNKNQMINVYADSLIVLTDPRMSNQRIKEKLLDMAEDIK